MYYGLYREKKLFISSGAIESAHREVIQQRLKRSGQRWSKSGAQQIAQLRVAKKSNHWQKIINIAHFGKMPPDLEKFHAPNKSGAEPWDFFR